MNADKDHKKNILIVGPDRRRAGGIAAVICNLNSERISKKYRLIYVLTQVNKGQIRKLLQMIKAVCAFNGRMMFNQIDLIHIHSASRISFYRKSVFILFGKFYKKRIVLHIHGGSFYEFYKAECSRWQQRYIKKIVNMTDVVIVLSDHWAMKLSEIIDPARIKIIPNSVVIPHSLDKPVSDKQMIRILYLGGIVKLKGVYDLIPVAEGLRRQYRNFKFILGGTGEIDELHALIREKGLSGHFDLVGWIDQKDRYYKQADIFVLPSYVEALPMVILEAASHGLPIVATRVGAIPEVIQDGESGFLINPGDTHALIERLQLLMVDHNRRERMGEKAREIVASHFSREKIMKDWESLYMSLCGQQ